MGLLIRIRLRIGLNLRYIDVYLLIMLISVVIHNMSRFFRHWQIYQWGRKKLWCHIETQFLQNSCRMLLVGIGMFLSSYTGTSSPLVILAF